MASCTPLMMYQTIALLALGVSKLPSSTELVADQSVTAMATISKTITCTLTGDPHAKTLNGDKCDLYGNGVFPILNLPGITIQGYFCPPALKNNGEARPSYIAATAVKVGGKVLTMVNKTLTVDSMLKSTMPAGGKDTYSLGGYSVEHKFNAKKGTTSVSLTGNDNKVKVAVINDAKAKGGTLHNVRFNAPMQDTEGMCGQTCLMAKGTKVASVEKQNGKLLFSAADIAWLSAQCGAVHDSFVECDGYPSTETVCGAAHVNWEDAMKSCREKCSCASQSGLDDCIYDYCEMGGDEEIANACAEACEDESED